AYDYDHTGGHYLGGNLFDVDKAFDRAGHVQEDVTYNVGGNYATFEYTSTAAYQVAQGGFNVITIHPFQDSKGNLGEDVAYFGAPGPSLIEYDSGGAHYVGENAVADRAYAPAGQQFAYDVTYFVPGVAVEYTNGSATALGTNIGY